MPKPRRSAGFAQEAFPRVPAPCNAVVDHFQRHGVTQDRIEGTVGDSHSAPAQFVKTAVVAPHNLVMIKTALVEQVLHRGFGLHRPAQQAHRATLIVLLGRVRDAAVRAAVWPLALGELKDCFWSHAMRPSSYSMPAPALRPAQGPHRVRAARPLPLPGPTRCARLPRAPTACGAGVAGE